MFWALRGGGAGSWGVVISATVRTYPFFNATSHTVDILAATNESTADLMALHARHIFDWEDARGGQYYTMVNGNADASIGGNLLSLLTYFPNSTADEAKALLKPFLDGARSLNCTVGEEETAEGLANDLLFAPDVSLGINDVLGSRLIPAKAFKTNPETIGQGMAKLIEEGVPT